MSWSGEEGTGAYGGTRPADEEAAFRASLASGVTLFDTMGMYGRGKCERRVGQLARGTNAVIATKFLPSRLVPPAFPYLPSHLPKLLDAALARLGRTTVDVYQLRSFGLVPIKAWMNQLADTVEAGKVRAVGVSGFAEEKLRAAHAALEARGIPLASIQNQYSLLDRRPEFDGVLNACKELGVTLIAFSPLALGALSGKYRPGHLPEDMLRRRMAGPFRSNRIASTFQVTEKLAAIGASYGKSVPQVALRYLIEQGAVPIPGAKNEKQARDNAGALTFSLSSSEMNELREATSGFVKDRKVSRPAASVA
jgi:aryl-alcohol dehydrogenase-like predicted oxidoreductase